MSFEQIRLNNIIKSVGFNVEKSISISFPGVDWELNASTSVTESIQKYTSTNPPTAVTLIHLSPDKPRSESTKQRRTAAVYEHFILQTTRLNNKYLYFAGISPADPERNTNRLLDHQDIMTRGETHSHSVDFQFFSVYSLNCSICVFPIGHVHSPGGVPQHLLGQEFTGTRGNSRRI